MDGVDEKYLVPEILADDDDDSRVSVEEGTEAPAFEDEGVPVDSQEDEKEQSDEEAEAPKISARYIELIDSGGIGVVDKDDLSDDVEYQIQAAIDLADLILFVVDSRRY